MSYGLPALVSRYTAQPESVGNTGLIVLDVTPENILEKLKYFISLGYHERLSLSKSAYERAHSEFSYTKRLHEIDAVFASICPGYYSISSD